MPNGITFSVDFGKLPIVVQRGAKFQDGMKTGLKAGALYLKGKWAVYPPVRHQVYKPSQNWTPKQRGFFWANKKAGKLEVPYHRGSSPGSERLAQRFAVSVSSDGRSAFVGNNASYARYVVGTQATQAFYHKGNWSTPEQVVKKHGPETARIVKVTTLGYLEM